MKIITAENYVTTLKAASRPYHNHYYAMYSSMLGGMVTDPALMQLPIDDHIVHRGDGVFDTFKCVDGAIYNLDAHLQRLERSATAIGIEWPGGLNELRELSIATIRAGAKRNCSGRVMLARGPGGFGVSPFEAPERALYIIAYQLGQPFMKKKPLGATVRRSHVPTKAPPFAGIKNCNYLPNVLMKREAVEWGIDFVAGFDNNGFLTEGATENIGIVTRSGELAFPRLENTLAGTSMLRLMELARNSQTDNANLISVVTLRDITEQEIFDAAELLIVGTTLNVVAAVEYEGAAIGSGTPGPVWRKLNQMLEDDITENKELRTVVFSANDGSKDG